MRPMTLNRCCNVLIVCVALTVLGIPACNRIFAPAPATAKVSFALPTQAKPPEAPADAKPKEPEAWPPAGAKVTQLGPGIYLGVAGERRWVEVRAQVCLVRGYLEHLLSRDEAAKHHESIVSTSFDASHLHAALIAAGAKPGKPAHVIMKDGKPEFQPPTGDKVKITMRWKDDKGKPMEMLAQRWVRNAKTKKELDVDWVFAGSQLFPDQDDKDKPPLYGANDGRVITTSNFGTSLLDLPIKSDQGDPQGGLEWEVNTELVPKIETPVTLILEVKKDKAGNTKPADSGDKK